MDFGISHPVLKVPYHLQFLSVFSIQDILYLLCLQIITKNPAYALSADPSFYKAVYSPVQIYLPHIKTYDQQVPYHLCRTMAVTMFRMIIRF